MNKSINDFKFNEIIISKKEEAINENIINYISSRAKDTQCKVLSEKNLFLYPNRIILKAEL